MRKRCPAADHALDIPQTSAEVVKFHALWLAGENPWTVLTILARGDHPEWYGGLPRDPHVPLGVKFWKNIVRPLGLVAIAGAFFAAVGHYFNFGAKEVQGSADPEANLPRN